MQQHSKFLSIWHFQIVRFWPVKYSLGWNWSWWMLYITSPKLNFLICTQIIFFRFSSLLSNENIQMLLVNDTSLWSCDAAMWCTGIFLNYDLRIGWLFQVWIFPSCWFPSCFVILIVTTHYHKDLVPQIDPLLLLLL